MLTELSWLCISLALSTILAFIIFGRRLFSGITELHLFDTYFVLDSLHALLPVFLVVTFAVYGIKVFRSSFSQAFSNWILLLTGLAVIITFTFFIELLQSFAGSLTSYPPLSASGQTQFTKPTPDPAARFMITCLNVIQFTVLIILLYTTYRWGKSRKMIKVNM
jgi:hypothetical protein